MLCALLAIPEEFSMTERSIAHGSFTVKRPIRCRRRVFAAFADPSIKGKWFGDPEKESVADVFEFKVGGLERRSGEVGGDTRYAMELRYYDIVPDQRIVYAYDVEINGVRHSVSVATVEFAPSGTGTAVSVTEHGAFLDGHENPPDRQGGTEFTLDRLGALLANAK